MLMQFPEFVEFKTGSARKTVDNHKESITESQPPKELIRSLHAEINRDLADELLEYIMGVSPAFFEKLVIDLLLAMGYGGALSNAGQTIGRSGDGGIDGYIQEDKLGLSMIYVQAKRWGAGNNVQRPAVQAFVGSLMGVGATKGVFITTSHFSQGAREYADSIPNLKVVLIDGTQLTQLMIEHNVGVSAEQTFVIKRIDTDYFELS
ncbi:MAG: hypothetical protein CUN56_13575 [Phototrophicales bacterium]|nr:MAG: hypothetical protein CUN56_13575 [Phototrophicales bacterium]